MPIFLIYSHINSHKLDFKSSKCVFTGYSDSHTGYRCLHPSGIIYITRNVIFNELEFPIVVGFPFSVALTSPPFICNSQLLPCPVLVFLFGLLVPQHPIDVSTSFDATSSISSSPLSSHSDHHSPSGSLDVSPVATPIPVQVAIHRLCPISTHSMQTRSKFGVFKPKAFIVHDSLHDCEPSSVSQALANPNWKQAMEDEFDAVQRNYTWHLVPFTHDMHVVDTKWVF